LLEDKAKHLPWHIDNNDLLRNNGTAYVPLDKALQLEIMQINHNNAQGGYWGSKYTLDTIHHKYYWRGIAEDVGYYVQTCDIC
jgi:hypothetical protein